MPNELAFSASQRVGPPFGTELGRVDTSPYERIRVLAGCNAVMGGAAEISLNFIQGEGTPGLLDRYVLAPGDVVSGVYEVPGVLLAVSAAPTTEAPAGVDVWIWGYRSPGD
jgi:hypothetical protein